MGFCRKYGLACSLDLVCSEKGALLGVEYVFILRTTSDTLLVISYFLRAPGGGKVEYLTALRLGDATDDKMLYHSNYTACTEYCVV